MRLSSANCCWLFGNCSSYLNLESQNTSNSQIIILKMSRKKKWGDKIISIYPHLFICQTLIVSSCPYHIFECHFCGFDCAFYSEKKNTKRFFLLVHLSSCHSNEHSLQEESFPFNLLFLFFFILNILCDESFSMRRLHWRTAFNFFLFVSKQFDHRRPSMAKRLKRRPKFVLFPSNVHLLEVTTQWKCDYENIPLSITELKHCAFVPIHVLKAQNPKLMTTKTKRSWKSNLLRYDFNWIWIM